MAYAKDFVDCNLVGSVQRRLLNHLYISWNLKELISSIEDVWMSVQDLAFFLATHNYDAVPEDGYVEIHIDNTVLKLVPNGDKPGLCEIEARS